MTVEDLACHTAISQIEAYLQHPERTLRDLDAALAHIRTCSSCTKKLRFLASALGQAEEDALTCAECEQQLPVYYAGGELIQPNDRHALLLHLASCPSCAAMYQQLQELEQLAQTIEPDATLIYPAPDLAFLHPAASAAPAAKPWQRDQIGRLIVAFSAELLRMFQPLPLASAGVKAQPEAMTRAQIELPDKPSDLQATIVIERASANSATCNLLVSVRSAGRAWPQLGGIEVTLQHGEKMLSADETDPFGQVIFRQVAVADLTHLSLVIAPN